jgi:hypothetical protein
VWSEKTHSNCSKGTSSLFKMVKKKKEDDEPARKRPKAEDDSELDDFQDQ